MNLHIGECIASHVAARAWLRRWKDHVY